MRYLVLFIFSVTLCSCVPVYRAYPSGYPVGGYGTSYRGYAAPRPIYYGQSPSYAAPPMNWYVTPYVGPRSYASPYAVPPSYGGGGYGNPWAHPAYPAYRPHAWPGPSHHGWGHGGGYGGGWHHGHR